jgi:hypothetical protein
MADLDRLAADFRGWAGDAQRGRAPLYEIFAQSVAEDPAMLALAGEARPGQPHANVLFGTVHYLLLSGVEDPLADYYGSCGGTRAADDGDPYAAFCAFVDKHRDALLPEIRTRITNTNEVGRSALVYPAYDIVARETGAPLHLVEMGSSGGLNLNWHRYGYRYLNETGAPFFEIDTGSGLVLTATLKGAGWPRFTTAKPAVASAVGLELHPADVTKQENRRWLRALIWPDRRDRLARLDAALEIAQAHPPRVEQADVTTALEAHLAAAPPGAPVCLSSTIMLYQLGAEGRAKVEAQIARAADERVIYWARVEGDGAAAGGYPLHLSRYRKGEREDRPLARCDPHGDWLTWAGA